MHLSDTSKLGYLSFNPIKCANCQGNHPADYRDCLASKREKEVNTLKYTNNISFPEARKIIQ